MSLRCLCSSALPLAGLIPQRLPARIRASCCSLQLALAPSTPRFLRGGQLSISYTSLKAILHGCFWAHAPPSSGLCLQACSSPSPLLPAPRLGSLARCSQWVQRVTNPGHHLPLTSVCLPPTLVPLLCPSSQPADPILRRSSACLLSLITPYFFLSSCHPFCPAAKVRLCRLAYFAFT